MYTITAVLALGLAVTLERSWLLWVKWRVDTPALLARIATGDVTEAIALAGACPLAGMMKAGNEAKSADAAWDAMSAEAAMIEAQVRHRLPWLAMVGNVATMLGLLGTVYGLILAFSSLSDASSVERATRLSTGIATAMATTAWGLLVGIPALAAHAIIDGKANQTLSHFEAVASRLAAQRRS